MWPKENRMRKPPMDWTTHQVRIVIAFTTSLAEYRNVVQQVNSLEANGKTTMIVKVDDLSKLPFAVALSRHSRLTIQQNLLIAWGVIAVLIPAGLLGIVGIALAVLFHEGSTLLVVGNALRLLRFGPDQTL